MFQRYLSKYSNTTFIQKAKTNDIINDGRDKYFQYLQS